MVNPGISGAFFRPAKTSEIEKIRKKYNLADKFIFYLGNLEPRKNVEALIAAFEKINQPDWHLVIAGGQAWKYKNIYKLWQRPTHIETIVEEKGKLFTFNGEKHEHKDIKI